MSMALTATPRPTSQGTMAARKISQRTLSRSGRVRCRKPRRREPAFEDHQRAGRRGGQIASSGSDRHASTEPANKTAQSPTRQSKSPVVKTRRSDLGGT